MSGEGETWPRALEAVAMRLATRAVGALLVTASGAGGADDNHASALAAVFVGRHFGMGDGVVGKW